MQLHTSVSCDMMQFLLECLLWVEMRDISLRSSALVSISTNNQCICRGCKLCWWCQHNLCEGYLRYFTLFAWTCTDSELGEDWICRRGTMAWWVAALRVTSGAEVDQHYFSLLYYFVEQWRFAPPTSATEVDQNYFALFYYVFRGAVKVCTPH